MQGLLVRLIVMVAVFGTFALIVRTAFENAPDEPGSVPVVRAPETPIKERMPEQADEASETTVLDLIDQGEPEPPEEAEVRLQEAIEAEAATAAAIEESDAAVEAAAATPSPPPVAEAAPEPNADETEADDALAALPAATPDGTYRIQLAAVKPGVERHAWSELQRKLGPLLADLKVHFQAVSTDNGVLVRIQGVGFAAEDDAKARCERIRATDTACFVVGARG